MAITKTIQAKEFMAGAPEIKLKGDLRLKASAPDPMDERNSMMEFLSLKYYGKPLKDLTEDEIIDLEEAFDDLITKKSAPSMMMAEGGIMQTVPRQGYFLGKIVRGVKKAVKGVTKTVKKNPLLALAALNFAPALVAGGKSMFFGPASSSIFGNPLSLLNLSGASSGKGAVMDALKIGGAGSVITGLLAAKDRQPNESDIDFAQRQAAVKDQLDVQFRRLYPQGGNESDEDYDIRISALVEGADDSTIPVGEMAEGGRVMRAFGSDELVEKASGIEGLPININSKGVKELDLRETGGFIPPVGVKEKADDIPAMLSNNEFVMTADAVRAAGGGSVNKGAQRMYDLMKNLESKVV